MKLKLNNINSDSIPFVSYEWCPSSQSELDILVNRVIEYSKEFMPLFCAVPWHVPHPGQETLALKFAIDLQQRGQDVMFHLCCQNLTESNVLHILKELKKHSIRNIFALRGDSREYSGKGYFKYARELVHYIRSEFGSYFTICVAGYPSGHPDNCNQSEELKYLKEKVDAGADFIISQIVFDASEFIQFVQNCRSIGIQVPIIPGILPVQDFDLAERISKRCRITIPNSMKHEYLALHDNPKELENLGIQSTLNIIKSIVHSGIKIPGIHFFTFNRAEMCLKIKKELCNILMI